MWVALTTLLVVLATCVPGLVMFFTRQKSVRGKHVVITGGSKGIGLSLAKEAVARGANVTILARNMADLDAAQAELEAHGNSKIVAVSADTTSSDQLAAALQTAEAALGPTDILICNAGLSIPKLFLDAPLEDFEHQTDVNYMGAVRTLKTWLPGMAARGHGHVVLVASALATLGFAGYSSYAPSKWALRGLAECLRNELLGTGIQVSIGYPPDTDTPGYKSENVSKPPLCVAANAALGSDLYPSDAVAGALWRGIAKGDFHLPTPDVGQMLLVDSMAGISPGVLPTPLGTLLAPVVRIVLAFLRVRLDGAVVRARTADR